MKRIILAFVLIGATAVLAPTIRIQGPPRLIVTSGGGGSTNSAIRQYQAGDEYINQTTTNNYQTTEAFQN